MMETSNQHLAKSMLTLFDAQLDEWRNSQEMSIIQERNYK